MNKKVLFLSLTLYVMSSCMTESNHLSPLSSSFSPNEFSNFSVNGTENRISNNVYAAEISKLTASFPTVNNKKFDKNTSLLKYQVQYYLEVNTVPSLEKKARKNVIKTYKEVQNLFSKLTESEKELVKIHLVKIKTNLTKLKVQASK